MNKRNLIIGCLAVIVLASAFVSLSGKKKGPQVKEITPFYGRIESAISATGAVKPQNRLEIKPPISGRIDEVLVVEGQKVKVGDTLALMSSTDRAALLDAARMQGAETVKKWEDVYKATPLIATIDGEVIVKSVKPGQAVTQTDAVVVLSDRLIVQAQVDETDVGKIKNGQEAVITLDAYPDVEVKGRVDHIYYESSVVNNVTIYNVDVVPDEIPDIFRSGMSANVKIIREAVEKALLLPLDAVKQGDERSYVLMREEGKIVERGIKTGLSDDTNIQVTAGLEPADKVVMSSVDFSLSSKSKTSTNPFVPTPPRGKRK